MHRRLGFTLLLTLLVLAPLLRTGAPAGADNRGKTGYSGNPATTRGETCASCHTGGIAPQVAIFGPQTIAAGATHAYTLSIEGGQAKAGGFDVSASDGVLAALPGASDVKRSDGEVTHTRPKNVDAEGELSFAFLSTAPAEAGTVQLYGAGTSVDLDGRILGDAADAFILALTVDGSLPTAAPTPTSDATPVAPTPTTLPGDAILVDGGDFWFNPPDIAVDVAQDLTVKMDNVGLLPHNIVFVLDDDRRAESEIITAGESLTMVFRAPTRPGRFAFYCGIGNHRELGMEGWLTVGAPPIYLPMTRSGGE